MYYIYIYTYIYIEYYIVYFGHTLVTLVLHSHKLSQLLYLIIISTKNSLVNCEHVPIYQ